MTRFHTRSDIMSWGRTVRATHAVAHPAFLDELREIVREGANRPNGILGIGLRRSYGDSCLNAEGALIDMTGLDRLVSFDPSTGVLTAEAGTSLAQVLDFAVPRGYFLPVTPGTRNVTLGGAVANDVHGKNHHSAGTFGNWVQEIGLLRSDGTRHTLRPGDGTGLFEATVGGLGITGLITHVKIQLKPITSSFLDVETIKFGNLDQFFSLASESSDSFEYTVAWIDCLARGKSAGRGIFSRARHSSDGGLIQHATRQISNVPFDAPDSLLNRYTISAFNGLYYGLGPRGARTRQQPYGSFFYPLDAISNWNRLYGKRGMYQYQSVVPFDTAGDATSEMLAKIAEAGQGSFLVVLKTFGARRSPGLLSFPMEGTTLALDFANRGPGTLDLLNTLDDIVKQAGGRLYPAKDSRIPPELFFSSYPAIDEFRRHIDPGFSSSFWRRMTA